MATQPRSVDTVEPTFFGGQLADTDPQVDAAIEAELGRQRDKLELIASENIVSTAVLRAQGSVLTNKYAEGYPGRRYYGGCEHVDVTEQLVKGNSLGESWFGHRGQISHPLLAMLVPDLMEREIFCCGPEPFMALVQDFLRDAGFDMAHYHQESFGEVPAETPAEQVAIVTEGGEVSDAGVPVVFADWGVTGTCQPGQTVLEAARAVGVRIPAACESGICGTCKTKKISGEVVMNHNGGILDEEVEEGYILACCSRPLGPLELEA